jgi:hypothetical protein
MCGYVACVLECRVTSVVLHSWETQQTCLIRRPNPALGCMPEIIIIIICISTLHKGDSDEDNNNNTYLLHAAQSFLRSWPVFAANQEIPRIFMEPEGSLPYSQVPATCPYPEPTPSSPHDPLQLPQHPS